MKDELKPRIIGDVIAVIPSKPHPRGGVFWQAEMVGKALKAEEKVNKKIKKKTASPLAHALLKAHDFTSMDNEVRRGLWSWFDADCRMALREPAAAHLLAAIGDCHDREELAKRLAMACKEIETECPPAQGGPVLVRFNGKQDWILMEVAIFEVTKRLARENASRGEFTPPTQKSIADAIEASCGFRRGRDRMERPGSTKWDDAFFACGLGSLPTGRDRSRGKGTFRTKS